MNRLDEIKERTEIRRHMPQLCNNPMKFINQFPSPFEQTENDIDYLLSKLETAEKALGLIAELYVPFTNKEVVDTTNTIKEMASKALQQLRE